MKVGNLNSSHLNELWTIVAPQFIEPVTGELLRVEHLKTAKGRILFIGEVLDKESGDIHKLSMVRSAEYATSIMIGDKSITVPADTPIQPATYDLGGPDEYIL